MVSKNAFSETSVFIQRNRKIDSVSLFLNGRYSWLPELFALEIKKKNTKLKANGKWRACLMNSPNVTILIETIRTGLSLPLVNWCEWWHDVGIFLRGKCKT